MAPIPTSRQRRCSSIRAIVGASIRSGTPAGCCGILQADAYAGLNALYKPEQLPSAHIQGTLLGLNVGRSDDLSPPLGFVGDKLAEFGW